jgi:DNA-binding response OmpR family regulator
MKILVADDNKVMLNLLKTLLELEGGEAITVARAEEIIPKARETRPDLIMLDFHLAAGDTMGILQQIKADEALKQIPVIVASGMDRAEAARRMGADDFILKPFRPAELIERFHRLIEE